MTRPRAFTALAIAAFLRWLATGHVTFTIARTPVTVPALAVVGAVLTVTALAAAAVICAARAAVPPLPLDNPGQEPPQ